MYEYLCTGSMKYKQDRKNWVSELKNLLNHTGLDSYFDNPDVVLAHKNVCVKRCRQVLINQFIEEWKEQQANSVRGQIYSFLRPNLEKPFFFP